MKHCITAKPLKLNIFKETIIYNFATKSFLCNIKV